MLSEANGLPIGGGLLLVSLLYAGVAYFAAGPVVGERTISKSNWGGQCKAALVSEIEARRPVSSVVVPKFDCNSILGLFGKEGQRVCRQHGNPAFNLPGLDQLQAVEQRKNELIERRLSQAASQAGSRCGCAVSVTLEKNATSFALYAGSARLISPSQVTTNLQSELLSALHSPHCTLNH